MIAMRMIAMRFMAKLGFAAVCPKCDAPMIYDDRRDAWFCKPCCLLGPNSPGDYQPSLSEMKPRNDGHQNEC